MNKVILLVLLMPFTAFGQIVENFEQGAGTGWIQSPEGHWINDDVNPISGNFSLHHSFDNSGSGTDVTGVAINDLHPGDGLSRWSFCIRHGCDASSSNCWGVYLMSDINPESLRMDRAAKGFVAGVNLTGNDDTLRLWKVRDGTFYPVVATGLNWQTGAGTQAAMKIVVERSQSGQWTIRVSDLSNLLISSSSGIDNELFYPGWFSLYYKYSSARDRLLWLDDVSIEGTFYVEEPPPDVPPVHVSPGDIVISEIMADPLPVVSLPGKEYLEISNTTDKPVKIQDWHLTDGNQKFYLPGMVLFPGKPVIVCHERDAPLFGSYGETMGLKSFPALTDGGKVLAINDSTGKLIHGIKYSYDWYGDELKSDGGWSLEMIDMKFPFYQEGNWHASLSKEGGSPGKPNSVSHSNPDMEFFGIENVFPDDSSTVRIKFSETLTGLAEEKSEVKIGDDEIADLAHEDPLLQEYIIIPEKPLERETIYTVSVSDEITDFAGNRAERNGFSFGITERALTGDLMFNELLFNPAPGEPDYIEFINVSGRIVDASRLMVVSVNDETNDTSDIYNLSSEQRCILPGSFYAVTTDRDRVLERFYSADPNQVFEVSSLPSMPDDKGHLVLFSRELDKIDEVRYDEDMHYPLLQATEGISLEKVRPQPGLAGEIYWHSASESSGWGTPGAVNSVFSEEPAGDDRVILSSTRITTDNDGIEDLLVIDLNLAGNGNVVSVMIFDESGGMVKRLTDNLLAGQKASIVWDGTDDGGRLVRRGIYILLISAFDDEGKRLRWKKVCAVI